VREQRSFKRLDLFEVLIHKYLNYSVKQGLNLFKHVTQLMHSGFVTHLYSFSDATTVAHTQSRNKNN